MNARNGNWLLVDNSNTRTKLMLARREGLLPGCRMVPTDSITGQAVAHALAGWEYSSVLICSVVPRAASILRRCFSQPVDFVSKDSPLPLELDYDHVETLGADRIANAVALAAKGHLPGVAVDIGTAATFDVVVPGREKPRFIGGAITPGLAAFTRYLENNTAQLPAVGLACSCRAIGHSTAEAVQAGALHGCRGLIRGLLQATAEELGQRPYVIATGGDAPLLASPLAEVDEVDPLLTFRGIHLIARELF